jgi:hypothetical protein
MATENFEPITIPKVAAGTALTFVLAGVFFLFEMYCVPNIYDEGLVLTAAMRVLAGQIPHRDFYANYGPAQFYILAGLFKLFGSSLFVERTYDLMVRALVVSSVYAVCSFYCRRWIAASAAAVTAMWFIGVRMTPAAAVVPVSLLALISSSLSPSVFLTKTSAKRAAISGVIAGAAVLFRYDVGFALFVVHSCVMVIATYLRRPETSKALRSFWSVYWPYLLGFALLTLPPFLFYLAVAPISSLIHDVIVYPATLYPRMRRLPPSGNIAVYLPIIISIFSLFVLVPKRHKMHRDTPGDIQQVPDRRGWQPFVWTFGILVTVLYFKGYVRLSPSQMYLPSVCSFPLLAVLLQNRFAFSPRVRVFILVLASVIFLIAVGSTWRETRHLYAQRVAVIENLLPSHRQANTDSRSQWCHTPFPLTKGLCFCPDQDRMQTILFITSHTSPDQKLFVGLNRHDRIYGNDNLIYFATQRLPATRWSHFDPGLQNSYPVQVEMIQELEQNAPPYVVLDSEFEQFHEPNDSSKSSGVTLLDDYLRTHYRPVAVFGALSILERIPEETRSGLGSPSPSGNFHSSRVFCLTLFQAAS